jgi:hypothetical protein
MDVRAQFGQQAFWRQVVKRNYKINTFQRRENFHSFFKGHNWPGTSLQRADGRVAIHADDQKIAGGFARQEASDVADMNQVETPVSPDDD